MEFHPAANLFPMLTGEEFTGLCKSIAKGYDKHFPIITYQGAILDGRNRYNACLHTGIDPNYQEYTGDNPIAFVVMANIDRRHLTSSQRAAISLDLESMLADQAKEKEGTRKSTLQRFAKSEPIHAAEQAAEMMGTNHAYVTTAKRIQEQAPELLERVKSGEMTIPQAKSEIRRQGQINTAQSLVTPEFPQKRYSVISADPPWRYDFSATTNREIENQYPTMKVGEICALPISDLCANDCVLFLWATNPKLIEAIRVLDAWGFEYKTNMVWVKDKIGMGYYARQRHELILIATRGNLSLPLPENRPDSVIEYRRQEHSKKPDIFYEAIDKMYPNFPKIELFARVAREGWDTWGNQI